jgi:hypothetical protein
MNRLKNILMCVALLPLLPAIGLAWLCYWLTPETEESTCPPRPPGNDQLHRFVQGRATPVLVP